MSSRPLVEVIGFQELKAKLMLLSDDKSKKTEILKILRIVAKDTVQAVKKNAPVQASRSNVRTRRTVLGGSLRQSIGTITGKKGSSRINPTIYVGPRVFKGKKFQRSGRNTYGDGWYGHMVDQGHDIYKNEKFRQYLKKEGGRRKSVLSRLTSKYDKGVVQGRVQGKFFMKKGYDQTKGLVLKESESAVAKYMQKQIDRLSR